MKDRWDKAVADGLEGVEALVYATRTIGQDTELVLWGGGNSSAKMMGTDHVGRQVRVLLMKGSGSDMKTITAKQFTPLRLDELLVLTSRQTMTDEEMVAYQSRCVMDPLAPKPSIETLLHAFIPAAHVYHTHADSICTLIDTSDSSKFVRLVYGNDVALVPYTRPGFKLAKRVAKVYQKNHDLRAIILDKHGLITWGDTPRMAYLETIKMVSEAERFIRRKARRAGGRPSRRSPKISSDRRHSQTALLLPILRGAIGQTRRSLIVYDDSAEVLDFVNNQSARTVSQVGPFTPDHLLYTKPKPLFFDFSDQANPERINRTVRKAVERYTKEYIRYFERFKTPGLRMLDPYPRVILVPRIGMFTCGKDVRAARITRDLYLHTIRVILQASGIDSYKSISPKDLCDFEYWPLENYKLTLLPPEKLLSRRIALVTGAGGAIGRAVATRFVEEGAAVILTDINESKIRALSDELNRLSSEGNTVAIPMDIRDESSVRKAFSKAVLTYGGLDILVSNAGVARSAPVERLRVEDWNESFAVNATGHFLVCREAIRIFKSQGLGGNIVVVATKNVLAPGKGFGAYSASKAAQTQLARVLAIEEAEFRVRVNMVNPDAVFEGSGLWSDVIRQERAKSYGIPVEQLEQYCMERNLLKVKISSEDVVEAILFLASERSAKTTGAIIPVDGGIREAFPR